MKHLLLLLFVLCLSLQANAQGKDWKRDPNVKGPFIWAGTLSVLSLQVRGPDYRKLPGADVTIVSRKDTIALVTDADYGFACYDKPLPDSVWVKVSYKGYETVEGKIRSRSSYEVYLKKKTAETPEVGSAGTAINDTVRPQSVGSQGTAH